MTSYTITQHRNAEIKHWRGKLRGYAVTGLLCMDMCRRVQVCMHMGAGVQVGAVRNTVTA